MVLPLSQKRLYSHHGLLSVVQGQWLRCGHEDLQGDHGKETQRWRAQKDLFHRVFSL